MHEKGQEPWTEIHLPRPSASYRNRHFRFTQILSFANKLLGCRSERNDAEAKRAARVDRQRHYPGGGRRGRSKRQLVDPRARYHGNNIDDVVFVVGVFLPLTLDR